ncbi:MAG: hypothetical protein II793_04515, partial [Bacteroidales bacterium]|nr:hypothetical protein [Bacteroidales bacterium]
MKGQEKTDNWLLSAYEKKGASASSSDIETEPEGKQNGTAPLQNTSSSAGKDTNISENGMGNVPDMSVDKASDARQRGFRMVIDHRYDRQEPVEGVDGRETEIDFSTSEPAAKGRYKVIESELLQPSHVKGHRNPLHFIPEAQPKERTDDISDKESSRIARDMKPDRITSSTNAYSGAPIINNRGEVIQGNNRAIALTKLKGYPESAAQYKQYLIDHAEEFGIDPDAVAKMKNPVLVREVPATDEEAIHLGQFKASDLETGGEVRIEAAPTFGKMTGEQAEIAMGIIFGTDENGEATIAELIEQNGIRLLDYLQRIGAISEAQLQSAYKRDGKGLTEDARGDIRKLMLQSIFHGGADNLPTAFSQLPYAAQKALVQAMAGDMRLDAQDRLLPDVQNAIMACTEIAESPLAKGAKTYEDVLQAIEAMSQQNSMFSSPITERYTPLELDIAARLLTEKQNKLKATFAEYQRLILGEVGDIFSPVEKLSRQEAVEREFNTKENKNNDTRTEISPLPQGGSQRGSELGRGERPAQESEQQPAARPAEQPAAERQGAVERKDPERPLSLEDLRNTGEPIEIQQEETAPQADENNAYGDDNTIVSKKRYEELKRRMQEKLRGRLNMGIDPELLAIGVEMTVYHIEAGARKFSDFAKRMIDDLGDSIRPYLKGFYENARRTPEAEEAGLTREMTPTDEVDRFDVANFDKRTTSSLDTAEQVAAERKIAQQAKEAERKLKTERTERDSRELEDTAREKKLRPATEEDFDGKHPLVYVDGKP